MTLGESSATFAEVETAAGRTAAALSGLGVGPGDVLATWGDTSLRQVELFCAAALLGLPYAPLNPRSTFGEAEGALAYLAPRLLVADARYAAEASEVGRAVGIDVAIIGAPGAAAVAGHDLDRATAGARPDPLVAGPGEDHLHAIYLTSGSTGRPKGVALSHAASWLRCYPGRTPRTERGLVNMFPLFHWAGWQMVTEAWQGRRPVHLVAGTGAGDLLTEVERWGAGSLYCIPAVWERVLAEPVGRFDTSSLETADTGTSYVAEDLIAGLRSRFAQAAVTVSYGSTEAGPSSVLADRDVERKHGTVGQACLGCVARVAADGEVLMGTSYLMDGYFRLPQETAEVLRDGWYRTGDLGRMDEAGYLTITGRARETIRSGGETIAPVEVENAVRTYPGVADVAVVGIPDDRWGEVVCAVVLMTPGVEMPGVEGLRGHLGPLLAPPKHPRLVVPATSLPRTGATGQLRRSAIRAAAVEELRRRTGVRVR